MATFALVHGAWHGAWCWERLVPLLEDAGHRVFAIDLPCDDPSAGAARYAESVVEALEGVGDDVVVVGHSLAGLVIPRVAAARAVHRLVFLCALLPSAGISFNEQAREESIFDPQWGRGVERAGGFSRWVAPALAAEHLYGDCEAADARWAFERLRPQAQILFSELGELDLADADRSYVLARGDRAVAPDWSRRAAPARLGVEPVEIDGDHSPFLSRPEELAGLLLRLAG